MKETVLRRTFLKKASMFSLGTALFPADSFGFSDLSRTSIKRIKLCGHLWVYASNYPPNWDCTPALEKAFSDMAYSGLYGIELMEVLLRHQDAVQRISGYSQKYGLKVSGSSYGVGFQMCDKAQHQAIIDDIQLVVPHLAAVGGKTLGISVGSIGRKKTEKELDDQAVLLKKIFSFCNEHGVLPNLHNHTYEVENDLHDLKGTMKRIPEAKLGPDINWLIRAGIDPVEFLETYGDRIVYLHIRDQYKNGDWSEYVGQGDTDFEAIGNVLKKIEFDGMAAIELAFPNDFEPTLPLKESWKRSRAFVQRTFEWK